MQWLYVLPIAINFMHLNWKNNTDADVGECRKII